MHPFFQHTCNTVQHHHKHSEACYHAYNPAHARMHPILTTYASSTSWRSTTSSHTDTLLVPAAPAATDTPDVMHCFTMHQHIDDIKAGPANTLAVSSYPGLPVKHAPSLLATTRPVMQHGRQHTRSSPIHYPRSNPHSVAVPPQTPLCINLMNPPQPQHAPDIGGSCQTSAHNRRMELMLRGHHQPRCVTPRVHTTECTPCSLV